MVMPLTKPNKTIFMAKKVIKKVTKINPVFSTSGEPLTQDFLKILLHV